MGKQSDFLLGGYPGYAAGMPEIKKQPKTGGFTAFSRVCDYSNLVVVLSDTFIFDCEYHRAFTKMKETLFISSILLFNDFPNFLIFPPVGQGEGSNPNIC